ncbi:MAG: PDZ domain-containing protein [Phycisphaerales bacterium]|nr:PDZ domain-containing protein [Phycisphaerales bacterium]
MMLLNACLVVSCLLGQGAPSAFDALVARLDSQQWSERELATYELAHVGSGVTSKEIEARLDAEGLTLEQVVRLLRAIEIRLLHSPRGAVGIQMALNQPGDDDAPDGVLIRAVIPNMPAEGLIEVGDVITHIDGVQLRNQEDLAMVVQRHWPGDLLPFRVLRPSVAPDGSFGELVEVTFDLTLGSTEQLKASSSSLQIRDPEMSARIKYVNALQQRFGPVPTRVARPVAIMTTPILDADFDPVLAGVLQQLAAIEAGNYPATLEAVRANWLRSIQRTEALLADPDLQPEIRAGLVVRLARLQEIYRDTAP